MKQDRRDFIKLTGLGLAAGSSLTAFGKNEKLERLSSGSQNPQQFNMCNYAAPKLAKVRIGFIGLGNRGMAAVERMNKN